MTTLCILRDMSSGSACLERCWWIPLQRRSLQSAILHRTGVLPAAAKQPTVGLLSMFQQP